MRRLDSEPGKAEAEHSGPPAVTGETDAAPATVSEGQGALPIVSAVGPGAWNDALLGSIVQVAAGTDLHGDDVADAVPRVRAAVEAMTAIGPDDVIANMAAAQLVAAYTLAMDCYHRAAGDEELKSDARAWITRMYFGTWVARRSAR